MTLFKLSIQDVLEARSWVALASEETDQLLEQRFSLQKEYYISQYAVAAQVGGFDRSIILSHSIQRQKHFLRAARALCTELDEKISLVLQGEEAEAAAEAQGQEERERRQLEASYKQERKGDAEFFKEMTRWGYEMTLDGLKEKVGMHEEAPIHRACRDGRVDVCEWWVRLSTPPQTPHHHRYTLHPTTSLRTGFSTTPITPFPLTFPLTLKAQVQGSCGRLKQPPQQAWRDLRVVGNDIRASEHNRVVYHARSKRGRGKVLVE